ncbi:amino acid ABC transporter permease [Clostridiales bacterium PH28_bin88]|nr:amino acid ABC transporter permease [Clostridiales bacterium PH28_bin88]
MIESIMFGLTIGAILYLVSIGFAITFGTMRIINFAHGSIYALAVYFFMTFLPFVKNSFILALIVGVALVIPLSYLVERFIIRHLYGESVHYALVATYGVLFATTDLIKWIWGTTPYLIAVPTRVSLQVFGFSFALYRVIIIAVAAVVFLGLNLFFKKTIAGKVITAALDDSTGVRCLGIDQSKYFSLVFMIGSALAGLGGILYSPIAAAEPYIGFKFVLLAFAVTIVGGMGNLTGAFVSAFSLGMVIAMTARVYPRLSEMMVFAVMAVVLLVRKEEYE